MRPITYVLLLLLVCGAALAVPPTGERLAAIVDGALTAEPTRKNSAAWSTTIDDAIDTDLTGKTVDVTQLYVVTNYSASAAVCFGTVAYSGATACQTLCGTSGSWTGQGFAATMNCTAGDASMGSIIPAGQSRTFRYNGTRCGCLVASATASAQVERVVR